MNRLKRCDYRLPAIARGSRAVSVTPKVRNGRAVALVTLVKGTHAKTLSESLE